MCFELYRTPPREMSVAMARRYTARTTCPAGARRLAREELQHQPVDLRSVLVGGPVARARDAVHVADAGRLDLADQERGRAEHRIVALAPQQADAARQRGEI